MNNNVQKVVPIRRLVLKVARAMLAGFFLPFIGCAISNEGTVDFRKSTPSPQSQDEQLLKKTVLPLEMKNFSDKKAKIVENDSISVHLRTAYIKDFAETAILQNPFYLFTRIGTNAVGEIAVVANVSEMKTGKGLNFTDNTHGRLVFYSDNVFKGQPLNFNNMSIYGPIKYTGAPLIFRITIVELDTNSEQIKSMLKGLAMVGQWACAPAVPVLGVLNGIGQSLVGSDLNDTEFRYTMVLDPRGGFEELNHFVLQAGNYVFIRSENRQKRIPWEDLRLNENEGCVYWKSDASGSGKLYTDNTYLVIEINKDISSVEIDLSEDTYGELLEALKSKDVEKAKNLTMMANALGEALVPRAQTVNFNAAKDLLHKIKGEMSTVEACFDAEKLLVMMRDSLTGTGTLKALQKDQLDTAPKLSDSQVDYLLSGLRSLAKTSITRKEVANATDEEKMLELLKKIAPNCGSMASTTIPTTTPTESHQ